MSDQAIAEEDSATGLTPGVQARAPWRVQAVAVLPPYRLAVTFMDGSSGIADCSAILSSSAPGIYAPLADHDFFSQVHLELGVPTWPNGADLDPAWLYDEVSGGGNVVCPLLAWSVPF